ncbi:MAG: BCCT family transporter [Pseudomonadota bacterium]|nr:BCCT family transporter [Pseudomonadota bacterium]
MAELILSSAVILLLMVSLLLVLRWGNAVLYGEMPTRFFAFFAILFTSGLDVGLIIFPLGEFPVYATEAVYGFTNPLAIEFGFWGFFIWLFYFVTTFYFCLVEPRLKLFEIAWVKWINNTIVITTCAFTGYLFLTYLPDYLPGVTPLQQYLIVGLVLMAAVLSSTDIRYVKLLSLFSTWLFFALTLLVWQYSRLGFRGLADNLSQLSQYFGKVHEFVLPFSDYHAFYLFWWFAWSIMIGQFVARFVGGLRTWQLLLALLCIPSIPIALWFSVLFGVYERGIEITGLLNGLMLLVGVVFVVNSLDSLTRLYTGNLSWTVDELGMRKYVTFHWLLLYTLILLYQFTPLQIEWIGLVVIGLYLLITGLIIRYRRELQTADANWNDSKTSR